MNIRKKLTIASILMILIPVAVALLLCLAILFHKGEGSFSSLVDLYENDNGLLNVQTILYHNREQILDYEPEEGSDPENAENDEADDDENDDEADDNEDDDFDKNEQEEYNAEKEIDEAFGSLTESLSALGYSYEISCGGQAVTGNFTADARKGTAAIAGENYEKLENFAVSEANSSAIKRTYRDGEKTIEVLAYCDHYAAGSGRTSLVIREIFMVGIIFVAVLILAIVVSIFLLTKWLSGDIRKSLSGLSEGVAQIRDGNLSYRIRSRKKDELGQACGEFDEMAEYLEQSVEERERYEAGRKQMLAGISHDLRTPLTSIRAYTEGLRDGMADTEEKKQRYYRALLTRTGDLEALIDNLSLFSRYERGENHYEMERIDLAAFLQQYFRENEVHFEESSVKIQQKQWTDEPLFIEGDRKQLNRVLHNIFQNSVKYREKAETNMSVSLKRAGADIVLELCDDGPGVPEEERDSIFDAFYRGDEARQNPGNGSGLGLSIVKEIMKDHSAAIRAEAGEHGKGLKLVLTFPENCM